MPNIPVKGDMEGFGIVALEASSAGLPVVASNIEGIKDAIIDNKNGVLINPYDDKRYIEIILDFLINDQKRINFGKQAMEITNMKYNWEKISESYLEIFNMIVEIHKKT
jgi:phosphatidylinositol alpha-1,6-mannosyltransferase